MTHHPPMTTSQNPPAMYDELVKKICEAVPEIANPRRGSRIHHRKNDWYGYIISDFFNVDMCACCYVLYDHQAGYTHMEQYQAFTLPEDHQHYDLKIDVMCRPITLEDVLLVFPVVFGWGFISRCYGFFDVGGNMICKWYLGHDLSWHRDNAPETIEFLHSLLCNV